MKRWSVVVEIPAQQDIAEAHRWLAERAPEPADRWFNGIYDTIGSLETFPERCPLARRVSFSTEKSGRFFMGGGSINIGSFSQWPKARYTCCMFGTAPGWLLAKVFLKMNDNLTAEF